MDYKMESKYSKRYTSEEKFEKILQIFSGSNSIKGISRETGISKKQLSRWKSDFLEKGKDIFENKVNKKDPKNTLIERKDKEIALLKKLLEHYKRIRNHP